MKTSFLNFLESRNQFIVEAFNSKDIDKAFEHIDNVLKKHIDGLVPLVGYVKTKQGSSEYYSKQYMIVSKKNPENSSMFQINFSQSGDTSDVYSIDFFNDMELLFNGKAKANLSLYTLGSSIVYFLPIIWTVASSGNYNISKEDAIKMGRSKLSDIKESSYYVGALKYMLYEKSGAKFIKKIIKEDIIGPFEDLLIKNEKTNATKIFKIMFDSKLLKFNFVEIPKMDN